MSAPTVTDKYAAALASLWAGIRCQHGALLTEDCDECEPLLIIPGFEPQRFLAEHDAIRGGLL